MLIPGFYRPAIPLDLVVPARAVAGALTERDEGGANGASDKHHDPDATVRSDRMQRSRTMVVDQHASIHDKAASDDGAAGDLLTLPGGGLVATAPGADWLRYRQPPPPEKPTRS